MDNLAVPDALVAGALQAGSGRTRKRKPSDGGVESDRSTETSGSRPPTRRRLPQFGGNNSGFFILRNDGFPAWKLENSGYAQPQPLSTESLMQSSFQATLSEPTSNRVSRSSTHAPPEPSTEQLLVLNPRSGCGDTSHFDRVKKISKEMPAKELTRKGLEIWKALVNELKEAVLRQMEPANLARSVLNPRSPMRAYYNSLPQATRNEETAPPTNGNVRSPRESIWRSSFLVRDRGLTPRPIVDMSFERLGRLLYTKGCTNPTCAADRTEYILWEFGERYCHRCIQELTVPTSQLRTEQPSPILDYVPQHMMTGSRVGTILVHREDVARIKDEYKKFQEGNPDSEADKQWKKTKREENDGRWPRMTRFRSWLRAQDGDDRPDYRSERREYFERGALARDPELTPEILKCIPHFQRSIDDKRFEPTENSLRTLLPKVQAAKAKAIRMLQRYGQYLASEELLLSVQADTNTARVRVTLLNIARDVIDRMGPVSPYDLVLRALHDFRAYYLTLGDGQPKDNDGSFHALTVGDALMIFKEVLEPLVEAKDTSEALRSFKCGGCRRRTPGQTRHYTFEALLNHLTEHREHLDLYDFFSDLPDHLAHWLPWPARLPILAEHHLAPTMEDFDRNLDIPYQTRQDDEFGSISAFEDRTFSAPDGSSDDNAADNLLFALRQLLGSELRGDLARFNVKIVFEYVTRRYRSKSDTFPPLSHLDTALANPEFTRLASVIGKHKCGICSENVAKKKGPGAQTFERLVAHWRHAHVNRTERHWSEGLVKLPTDQHLRVVLNPPTSKKAKDPKKAREAFDVLFPPLSTLWVDAAGMSAASIPSLISEVASVRGSGSLMAFEAAGNFARNAGRPAPATIAASFSLFGEGSSSRERPGDGDQEGLDQDDRVETGLRE